MKVFLSWSGETSKAVATALRDWLPRVVQTVQPWVSNHDIPSGSRWSLQLGEHLEGLKIGVLCLTPDNLVAPWILFEAGALSKALDDSLVCPYLFKLEPTAVEWPLAQFQLEQANKDGTKKLITTINDTAGESKLTSSVLEESFEMWWPTLENKLLAIEQPKVTAPKRSDRALLEEILDEVRRLRRTRFVDAEYMQPGLSDDAVLLATLTRGQLKTAYATKFARKLQHYRKLAQEAETANRDSEEEIKGDEHFHKGEKKPE
jgi:hypothetical protein